MRLLKSSVVQKCESAIVTGSTMEQDKQAAALLSPMPDAILCAPRANPCLQRGALERPSKPSMHIGSSLFSSLAFGTLVSEDARPYSFDSVPSTIESSTLASGCRRASSTAWRSTRPL